MFIEQPRWLWWKWLRRDIERVGRNDRLRWSSGNGWLLCIRRKHRDGRKRVGRPVFEGRCYGLGWIDVNGWGNGWNDSHAIGRREWHRREVGGNGWGNGWNDSRAIGRRERRRRKVGVWWSRRNRWRCAWR
jgi:hypothetical protein